MSSGVGAAESSGRSGDGRTAASPEPDPKVDWTGSPDQAREVAAARNVPYVLFFCTEETAKFAGEGPAVIADYRKSHPGAAPALTPFDDRAVVAALRKSGLSLCAKVPSTPAHAALREQHHAPADANTLVFCAPTGEALVTLSGPHCAPSMVLAVLATFQAKYAAWQRQQRFKAVAEKPTP